MKRLILPILIVVLFCLSFGLWLSGPPVNHRSFAIIQNGMTKGEVEGLIGTGSDLPPSTKWPQPDGEPKIYTGECYSIVVWYNAADEVLSKIEFHWIYRREDEVPLRYKIKWSFGFTK